MTENIMIMAHLKFVNTYTAKKSHADQKKFKKLFRKFLSKSLLFSLN